MTDREESAADQDPVAANDSSAESETTVESAPDGAEHAAEVTETVAIPPVGVPAAPPLPPPPPNPSQPGDPAGWAPPQPPPGAQWVPVVPPQPRPQASSNAIVALVLAIVSWVAFPVIPAIVALVLASKATKEIRASNGWLTGEGMALAAKIMSWINIGFAILATIFVIFLIVVVAANGGFEPSTVPSQEFSFDFGT
ncbi:MAG: DUF4190 domain-containing protein [Actinobacteria bacterium]|nr:DUF4190 domain-containing protein [Actinomycetota bacterium]